MALRTWSIYTLRKCTLQGPRSRALTHRQSLNITRNLHSLLHRIKPKVQDLLTLLTISCLEPDSSTGQTFSVLRMPRHYCTLCLMGHTNHQPTKALPSFFSSFLSFSQQKYMWWVVPISKDWQASQDREGSTYIRTYVRTYIHTYIKYIHTRIQHDKKKLGSCKGW